MWICLLLSPRHYVSSSCFVWRAPPLRNNLQRPQPNYDLPLPLEHKLTKLNSAKWSRHYSSADPRLYCRRFCKYICGCYWCCLHVLVCDWMWFMCQPTEWSIWKNTSIQMLLTLKYHFNILICDWCTAFILLIILNELAIIIHFHSVMTQVQGIVRVILTS